MAPQYRQEFLRRRPRADPRRVRRRRSVPAGLRPRGRASDGGDGEEAAYALSDAAWGKVVLARVEERSGDCLSVTLFDKDQQNINEYLVKEGLVRVTKANDKRFMPQLKALRDAEQEARRGRKGMWRFGDIDDDDDDEFGMRRQQKIAAPPARRNGPGAK